ncbi:hypothetical protein KUV51_11620 [Tateyamaria omphalii]|uniref:hypothetical protein n=1 Tax=Tateyamaria omphalii TaxID=299262 RepID=UPI001C9961BD|nr:hypothetical protein [Tateyamaria omphalii]MBY5933650.1 hypothetical protein [Tateyamaria omphalii]
MTVTVALLALLTGCAAPMTDAVTRLDNTMAFAASVDREELQHQADALSRMARDLERRSRIKGAVTGAAVGCGLVLVSGSNAGKCVTGAAAGGAIGAVVGHHAGQRQVQKRVDLVSANALVRSLRGMTDQMDAITVSLPELLREQDAELADLAMRRDAGALSDAEYEAGVDAIRLSRAELAAALSASEDTARRARANMDEAAQQGQTGLDWHMLTTDALVREAHSARSSINLLS